MISGYLSNESQLDDHTIHLLFSANRCEKMLAPEVGLLAPDLKAAERGGYGGERYEKLEFQKNVARYYKKLSDVSWKIIDECQHMEDVEKQLKETVLDCVKSCQNGKSVSQLWLS
ncbi:putative dTMP kinase [Helianthus anomalus]